MLLCLLIVISEIPILARNVPNIVFYGTVLLFFASSVNALMVIQEKKIHMLIWIAAYFIILLVYKVLAVSSADLAYYSTTAKFLFFLLAMLIIGENLSQGQKRFIIATTVLSMLFTTFDNIRLYMQYGAYTFVHLFQWERFTTNSVNTTYVSSMLFMSGILLIVLLHTKDKLLKIGAAAVILLDLVFIAVIAQRMIILGLAVILLPLILLCNNEDSGNRIIIIFLLFMVVAIVLLNAVTVIDLLDKIIGSSRLHVRFEQIKAFLSSKEILEVGGTSTARVNLYLTSIRTWFSSPAKVFFGAGDHRITNLIIGNHSDLIDECARYGLLGMLIWIPMICCYMKWILSNSKAKKRTPLMWQMKAILMVYLLNALLSDVYEATVGIQIFIMLPVVVSLIRERENANGFECILNSLGESYDHINVWIR